MVSVIEGEDFNYLEGDPVNQDLLVVVQVGR